MLTHLDIISGLPPVVALLDICPAYLIAPASILPIDIIIELGLALPVAPMFYRPLNIRGLALSCSIANILGRWPTRQGVEMLPFCIRGAIGLRLRESPVCHLRRQSDCIECPH